MLAQRNETKLIVNNYKINFAEKVKLGSRKGDVAQNLVTLLYT